MQFMMFFISAWCVR